jgi:DNA-binding transcriptional LysR family regulator
MELPDQQDFSKPSALAIPASNMLMEKHFLLPAVRVHSAELRPALQLRQSGDFEELSIVQLYALIAFVHAGSIAEGARILGKDQSTMSRHISAVGKIFPSGLTRRLGKKTVPTEAAVELGAQLAPLLGELNRMTRGEKSEHKSVAFATQAPFLAAFASKNLRSIRRIISPPPNPPCSMLVATEVDLIGTLRAGRSDFVICRMEDETNVSEEVQVPLGRRNLIAHQPVGQIRTCIGVAREIAAKMKATAADEVLRASLPLATVLEETELPLMATDALSTSNVAHHSFHLLSDALKATRQGKVACVLPSLSFDACELDGLAFFEMPSVYWPCISLVWSPDLAAEKFVSTKHSDPNAHLLADVIAPLVRTLSSDLKRRNAEMPNEPSVIGRVY